jgi:hypothetical protein
LRHQRRLVGQRGLLLLVLTTLFRAASAQAGEDPYLALRAMAVDRILICDDMYPTRGHGVVWIDDPAEIAWLLAPLGTRQGPAALCGYQRAFYFFSAGRLLARHRLNTECHDYVPGGRADSRRFDGELARRWWPYLSRMETSTGTWDVRVVFPSSMPEAAARAALREAGLAAFTLPMDDDDRTPWAMVRYQEEESSPQSWFEPVSSETRERITDLVVGRCGRGSCQVEDIRPWERYSGMVTYGVRVRFVTNDELGAFARSLRWLLPNPKLDDLHAAPPLYWMRTVIDEPPTEARLTALQRRIRGASSVEWGDLRREREPDDPWMTPSEQ